MRLKEFQDCLRQNNIDYGVLFSAIEKQSVNFYYLCEYNLGCFIVPAKGKPFLLSNLLEYEKSRLKCRYEVIPCRNFISYLKDNLKGRIGVDCDYLSANGFNRLKENVNGELVDVSKFILKLREIKTSGEIKIMKKAFEISDKIFGKVADNFKKFKTEKDVMDFMEDEAREFGSKVEFCIVASGKNSSQPHHETGNVKLNKGFCVVDFGFKYRYYCTDTTRTLYLGNVGRKEREFYDIVLNCQQKALELIKADVECEAPYNAAVKELGKYADRFIHSLGHGIGLEVHENPYLMIGMKNRLERNMFVTDEPGIYFSGKFGIRIEDTVLVGKKPTVFSRYPKDLVVVR